MLRTCRGHCKVKWSEARALYGREFSGKPLPQHAQVVVIGGGIIGNSVAYHLGKSPGMSDVVVLEQNQLTAGTTWHAAGLMVTFGSLSETSTDIRKYTKNLYATLEEETGLSTGFKPCGFIELATSEDRLEEYRRISSFNRRCGVDVHEISPDEVKKLFPLCETEDVLAGFYVESDGRVNPVDASMSLAKGARMTGNVTYFEGPQYRVEHVSSKDSKNGMDREVTGVMLGDGTEIQADFVVNCTGMWARQMAQHQAASQWKLGPEVVVPNQAAEHYYLVTDSIPEVDPNWPVIEDPSSYTYIRPEGGGLMVGLFEGVAAAWSEHKVPADFAFGEIEPDWDRMAPYVMKAMERVPASMEVGVKKFFCGPESFTPDLGPAVGESPEIQRYFVAAGMNSIGILTGGGIGRAVASWIVNGKPDVDVTGINVDRFAPYQVTPNYRKERVVESLGLVYKCHYPFKGKETARKARFTPFYDRFKQRGAYFRDVSGYECADWFLNSGKERDCASADETTQQRQEMADALGKEYGWGKPAWFPQWAAEHRACREGVMLLDMSFMSKFLVQGRDCAERLNYLCTADVSSEKVPVGTITYTQWLNDDGTLEGDVTVTRLEANKFLVIVTDTMHRHAETWLKRHLDPEGNKHVFFTDVTGAYAQLNVQGPLSRQFMEELVSPEGGAGHDIDARGLFSNENFPFRAVKEVAIGYARVLCSRITYLGELGYELYIPTDQALHVYDRMMTLKESARHGEAAPHLDLVHGGLKALASLRMEKGYRDYGHDMDNTDTLLEMGLGFTADFTKTGGFKGQAAVEKQRASMKVNGGLSRRLVSIAIDDNPDVMLYHGETIFRDGVCVGDVRAGAYGHTLGCSVGLAHIIPGLAQSGAVVNKKYLQEGKWEVEVAGTRYPVRLSLGPLYDPKNTRVKA